jgi:S-formylglutathione hydrolase
MTASIETLSEHRCFGGTVGYYRHRSAVNDCDMRFAVFVPPAAAQGPVPVLTWLAGLTCTEETFMIKAGAQRVAAELGLMLVAPDTSPRGPDVPDAEDGAWDLGLGAGFYLDATEAPWSRHYRMHSYLVEELPGVLAAHFPCRPRPPGPVRPLHGRAWRAGARPAPSGSLALPVRLRADRGADALSLGPRPSRRTWALTGPPGRNGTPPSSCVVPVRATRFRKILVDQGLADAFLPTQLNPEALEAACAEAGQRLRLRRHAGYDHGYFFIASFIEDHLRHHAAQLGSAG